jgi:DNA-binding NarL/FixJ family response regulator
VEAAPAAGARPPTPPLCSLTAREQEILELLSEGHQNKLIAHRMSLSEHTVKVHVHNLLSKLRVSNRTQAAATYRRGLVGAPGIAAPMAARGAGGAGAAPTP